MAGAEYVVLMQEEHTLIMLLARLVGVLRDRTGDVAAQKEALRSLADLTSRRSWTIRLESNRVTVEGNVIPPDLPMLRDFIRSMRAHDVAEVHLAHRVSGLDVMHFLRILAEDSAGPRVGGGIQRRLQEAQVRRVWVLGTEGERSAQARRNLRATETLEALDPSSVPEAGDGSVSQEDLRVIPAIDGAAYEELIQSIQASRISLAAAVKRMRNLAAGAQLSRGLNVVTQGVMKAVRANQVEGAIEAVMAVIRQEAEAPREDIRICYGVALRRMLASEVLRPLAKLLLDPLYADDVMAMMVRAGTNATQLLLDMLVAAPTFAERRAFLAALRNIEEGTDNIVSMLNHHEWYVVRNVADLIAELGIDDAVPALGKVVEHEDARVRRSVGIALARIGNRATVRHLRTILRDPDPGIRMAVAKEIGGGGLGALVMPLVNQADSEEEESIRAELYRALGRIGTPDAIQALNKICRPSGKLFGPNLSESRRAAVEGLVLAGGAAAVTALESLRKDRDRSVRDAARQGLLALKSDIE